MPYEYNKLRGRIIEKYGSQSNFAKVLGVTRQGLSGKMTGRTSFSQKDINRWCELLEIETGEISKYFFA